MYHVSIVLSTKSVGDSGANGMTEKIGRHGYILGKTKRESLRRKDNDSALTRKIEKPKTYDEIEREFWQRIAGAEPIPKGIEVIFEQRPFEWTRTDKFRKWIGAKRGSNGSNAT